MINGTTDDHTDAATVIDWVHFRPLAKPKAALFAR